MLLRDRCPVGDFIFYNDQVVILASFRWVSLKADGCKGVPESPRPMNGSFRLVRRRQWLWADVQFPNWV